MKIGKIKLRSAVELSDSEMKAVCGSYGESFCYMVQCWCHAANYDAFTSTGSSPHEAWMNAMQTCMRNSPAWTAQCDSYYQVLQRPCNMVSI